MNIAVQLKLRCRCLVLFVGTPAADICSVSANSRTKPGDRNNGTSFPWWKEATTNIFGDSYCCHYGKEKRGWAGTNVYQHVRAWANLFRHLKNERGTGAEIRSAIASGIVTEDMLVSYWPIFSLSHNSPQNLLGSVSFSILKWREYLKHLFCGMPSQNWAVYLLSLFFRFH